MAYYMRNGSCGEVARILTDIPVLPNLIFYDQFLLTAGLGAVTLLFILTIYFGWIRPLNIYKDLSATGFNHLKDGSYHSVEYVKRSFKDLVKIAQARRKVGDLPPVYPNGWFALIEADHVPPGQVRHVAALGENFAVLRTQKGKVSVLNAYCPHLGANMAIGGSVEGDCLECPFHKWRFSSSTGACTSVPYSASAPPAARVKKWASREVNDFIFVWYHAEGDDPAWNIDGRTEIESGTWRLHGRTDMMVSCHIQDIQENGADIGHLEAIHGPNIMAGVDIRHCERAPYQFLRHSWNAMWEASQDEKHKGIMTLSSQVKVFGKYSLTQVSAHVEQIGPAYVELNLKAFWGPMLLVMTVTPVEPMLQRIVHRMYAPAYAGPFARVLLYIETLMIQRDVMMWNHKKYVSKPYLVKEDSSIVRHRRWYNQFYSENSPKFSFHRDTLEW